MMGFGFLEAATKVFLISLCKKKVHTYIHTYIHTVKNKQSG